MREWINRKKASIRMEVFFFRRKIDRFSKTQSEVYFRMRESLFRRRLCDQQTTRRTSFWNGKGVSSTKSEVNLWTTKRQSRSRLHYRTKRTVRRVTHQCNTDGTLPPIWAQSDSLGLQGSWRFSMWLLFLEAFSHNLLWFSTHRSASLAWVHSS